AMENRMGVAEERHALVVVRVGGERAEVRLLEMRRDRHRGVHVAAALIRLVMTGFLREVALVLEFVGDVRARAGRDEYGARGKHDFRAGGPPLAVLPARLFAKRDGFDVSVAVAPRLLGIEAVGI